MLADRPAAVDGGYSQKRREKFPIFVAGLGKGGM
jgi:hypothetical protein